jgi:restriction system protein
MAIPDFQTMMLPLLRIAQDGEEHTNAEAREGIATEFSLTEEDRRELLPSGKQRTLDNRVAWALSYLRHALLLESTGRGRFRITSRGRQVLQQPPERITIAFLRQFPEFVEFQKGGQEETPKPKVAVCDEGQTPEEALATVYDRWREQFAAELLQRTKECSPAFFEELVLDLLVAMGYGGSRREAAQAVGRSGDGGIDGVIREDRLGLDVVYVQAKRWDQTVSRGLVQAFAGSLEGHRANKGVMITTSRFSAQASEFATLIGKRIVLIDGERLADLMLDFGVGVSDIASYTVKRIDEDYFSEAL